VISGSVTGAARRAGCRTGSWGLMGPVIADPVHPASAKPH
jgi:hypothetical protein